MRSMLPATGQKYARKGMNSPYHNSISTNGPLSWYATSILSVLGSHSLRRIFIPFYDVETRLATAAVSCHRANTQAVKIIEANTVVLLFLRFHLFQIFVVISWI